MNYLVQLKKKHLHHLKQYKHEIYVVTTKHLDSVQLGKTISSLIDFAFKICQTISGDFKGFAGDI